MNKSVYVGIISAIVLVVSLFAISLGVGYNRLVTKDEDFNLTVF